MPNAPANSSAEASRVESRSPRFASIGEHQLLRRVWRKRTAGTLALVLLLVAPSRAAEPQPQLTGDTRIHDPSVIEVDGQFIALGAGQQGPTHGAIRVKTSPDGLKWKDAGLIGQGPPAWAQAALGFKPLNVWAPSISLQGRLARVPLLRWRRGRRGQAPVLAHPLDRGRLAGTWAADAIAGASPV